MPKKNRRMDSGASWYKEAIIYELHVKAFCDSNGDGIGELRGLIGKLDYLQNLGVTALWLLPFYPSPLRDDGYDIADCTSIHPAYGKLQDFRDLLREAHHRGMRVITELVLNHTSDQHPWFQKSRSAKAGSSWRDFYVWSDTPDKYSDARIIFQDFESSNWTWDPVAGAYYWHRFYSHQPDLNYENPRVRTAMLRVLDFWLRMGVDGLRLDAVPYLFERGGTNCENLPETHAFLKTVRKHVEKNYRNRMLLAEANQWAEDAVSYFGEGDECHMSFNFPVMPRLFMAIQMEDRFPIIDIYDPPLDIPESCQWAIFLRNHDELTLEMVTDEERDYMYRTFVQDRLARINLGIRRRLAPLLGNDRRKIELMNIILFSLPGTPIIYYGDEIGMGDNYYLGDRDGVRTPMQWSPDRNAGFSRANPQKLYLPVIIDPDYHFESVNVETQERNTTSLLWWMKIAISTRKKFRAFGRGDINFLSPHNPRILAFTRSHGDETILVAANLSRFSQVAELDLSRYAGWEPEEIFSLNRFPAIRKKPYALTFGPYGHYWFLLRREREATVMGEKKIHPLITLEESLDELLRGEGVRKLEETILADYMKGCRWFGGKARTIRALEVVEDAPISIGPTRGHLLIIKVEYAQGEPELYLLPLFYASGKRAALVAEQFPSALVARVLVGSEEGVLYDGSCEVELHRMLLEMIAGRKKLRGSVGAFFAYPERKARQAIADAAAARRSGVLKAEQSNTSILYGEELILKLFRKLEFGINPDAEIVRALTEKAGFPHIPRFLGTIEYARNGKEHICVGLLQEFVANQGDAWTYALHNVGRFYERVLAAKGELEQPGRAIPPAPGDARPSAAAPVEELAGSFFTEMIALLGKRTGELHLALASLTGDHDFAPEPFSRLYQRAVYQSMRSLVRQAFALLEKAKGRLPRDVKKAAGNVLALKAEVLGRMEGILERKISAMKTRIHGDYHLGQVLFTGSDFVIIDFEGEPSRALSERRLKRSPLRDVAGMMRSFHYAAHAGLLQHPSVRPEDLPYLEPWATVWYHHLSLIFLRSYKESVGDAPFLPRDDAEFSILFDAFLLDKAVYELAYELNNRPDWVAIPLKGIQFILEKPWT